jgi:hypothetical protein
MLYMEWKIKHSDLADVVDVVLYTLSVLMTHPDVLFNVAKVDRTGDYLYVELFYEEEGFFPEMIGWLSFDLDVNEPDVAAWVIIDINISADELALNGEH